MNLFETIKNQVTESNSRKPAVAKALLYLVNEVNDGLGDVYGLNEWAEVLADDYGLDFEGKDANKVILKALSIMSDEAFKDEVDNFVYTLFENDDLSYLEDTLHENRDSGYIIKCLNLIKPYASEPEKIDQAISGLQEVNLDLRTTAREFQSYLHNNYEPWNVLGTTTGPRTYVDLFNVPTDYDIVGADYFNYAGRPSDMLNHIGYGWKQDGDNIVADLIGFSDSVEGSSVHYDQAPVSYGYSAVIDKSNKKEKFKEMAEALIKKAGEIKRKYKLGKR